MRKWAFTYAKTKVLISCAVTAQLISTFVFASRRIVQSFFLYPKLQSSSLLLWLYKPVHINLVRNPEEGFLMLWLNRFSGAASLLMTLIVIKPLGDAE